MDERTWYADGLDPEELAFQRLYGPWKVSTPADAQELMDGYDGDWWITGGWAIEAFTGVRREHEDVDVSLWRRDIEKLRLHLKGRYDLWSNAGGRLRPLTDQRPEQPDDADQIWLRRHALAPWEFDLQPNPDRDGRWVFRRDPTLDYALDEITWDRARRHPLPQPRNGARLQGPPRPPQGRARPGRNAPAPHPRPPHLAGRHDRAPPPRPPLATRIRATSAT